MQFLKSKLFPGLGLWVCRCAECLGIVGVYMCGVNRDCGCVHTCVEGIGIVGVYMCGVYRDCGCVHVWSVRDCGCVHVWSV